MLGGPLFDGQVIGGYFVYSPVTKTWQKVFDLKLTKSAYPLSFAHVCQDVTHAGPPYRTGGGFGVSHVSQGSWDSATKTLTKGNSRYITSFWAAAPYGTGNDPPASAAFPSSAALSTYGSVGWNKFRPAKPKVELGVFLAELRDFNRLFAIRVRQLTNLRGISNLYLAYQFGWVPILNDLRKAFTTYRDCAKIMKRLLQKNGHYERRGGTVTEGGDGYEIPDTLWVAPGLVSSFYPPPYTVSKTPAQVSREFKIWFEAAIMYLIPNLGDKYTDANVLRKLFGLTVSPAVVYELIPWSWCVDWFTNLGDCLQNLDSTADVSHAAYAFVMRSQTVSIHGTAHQTFITDGGSTDVTVPFNRTWGKRERAIASPFSPGLTDELLTLRQLTILGALGVQRFHR